MTVRRYDKSSLSKPRRELNGWLRGDAFLTRTGVFEYLNTDGSIRRELRLPEHVFDVKALQSFSSVPVTNDHPDEPLDATNTQKYQRGSVGSDVRREGDHVRASLLVTDAALVKLIEEGKVELSCGYDCDLAMTPGEWQGIKYDAVQQNIRGNHVAVVDRGRAGPTARINMDSAAAVMVRRDEGKPMEMVTIKIGDTEMQVPKELAQKLLALVNNQGSTQPEAAAEDKAAGEAAKADATRLRSELSRVTAERDALKQKVDAANGAEAEAKRKKDAAEQEQKIEKRVRDRLELEGTVRGELGEDFEITAQKTDRDLQLAVIAKYLPDFKADGRDDVYVRARFDATLELQREDSCEDALDQVRRDAEGEPEDDDADDDKPARGKKRGDEGRLDERARRDRMVRDSREAHKKPTTFGITKKTASR